MSTTSERWGGKFRVVRDETVSGEVTFYAERRELWLWDAITLECGGRKQFQFATQQEVENRLDALAAEIERDKAAKRGQRTKSRKVVAR